jgi:hypothetical protein
MSTELIEKENVENIGDGVVQLMERLAVNPDIDVEKFDRMLTMQERILDRQAEMDFNVAMAKLRKELPPIFKNKKNIQTNSTYADLDAIKKVADPLLTKYGFYDRYEDVYPDERTVETTCEIVHESGHSKRNSVRFTLDDAGIKGSINKTPTHATASSMTYGQRLSLCRALGIRLSTDDDGNAMAQAIDTEAAVELDQRINKLADAKAYKPKFLSYMKANSIQEIRAVDYLKAVNAIKAKEDSVK